jgi:Lar family restriction alleviation protein
VPVSAGTSRELFAESAARIRTLLGSIEHMTLSFPPASGSSDELLPCPFCGGRPYLILPFNGTEEFVVGCADCNIEFKAAWCRGESKPSRDIVAAWNRRATHPTEPGTPRAVKIIPGIPWVCESHGPVTAMVFGQDGRAYCATCLTVEPSSCAPGSEG